MTFLPYFLVGLIIGGLIGGLAGIHWFKTQNNAQLTAILNLIHNQPSSSPIPASTRPVLSRLRSSAVRVNRQLQDAEEDLETWQYLWQTAPIGYLQVNSENQILWCNAQAQEFLHIKDWQTEQNRSLIAVVRSFELDQLVNQARQTQVSSELEWQFRPNYTDQSADLLANTLKASTVSLPKKSVGIFLENRQPIVAMHKAQERWTTDLAHELRTPLTALRLMIETIQNISVEPSLQRWTDRMIPEIDRLAKLVQCFLELSQLEENPHQHIKKQIVSLDHIIQDAWYSLEPLSDKQNIYLQQLGETNIKLSADPGRLAQVFINLFDNAIKYSDRDSPVQVITNSRDQTVEIEIIDTGKGFAPKDLPHIFNRLFRSDTSRQRDSNASSITSGSGLGLAIVQQIVLAHNGTITAQNHPKTGHGCLKISLPID